MNAKSVLQKSLFPVLCLLISSWVAAAPASSVKVVKTADDVAIGKRELPQGRQPWLGQ